MIKKDLSRTALLLSLALLLGLIGASAQASIKGKPVVLVHGFQYWHLGNNPSDTDLRNDATEYWQEYWLARAEAVLHWSSDERVTEGISIQIRDQVKTLADNGTCIQGCVLVTHSTGDLVTRTLLRNLNGWLWQWGYSADRVQFLAVLDIAGAGGGTELADLGIAIVESDSIFSSAATSVVNWFMGTNASPGNMGVVRDLQPAVARSIATQNSAVPRLRFAGNGTAFLGASKPFILGKDDSVVPLHSACGSVLAEDLESCSSSIRMSGEIDPVAKSPSGLKYNHYPILMGDKTDHFDIITNNRSGKFVPVVNHRSLGGIDVDFNESTYWSWWHWDHVRVVSGGDLKSMSANIFDTLNQ